MGKASSRGKIWAWLVVLGCIGFYSIPTGIIGNTAGIFVAPVMDEFGWTQTDTTMYRTIQPLVAAVCAPIAGKIMTKYNPRWILTAVTAAFGLGSIATAFATEVWQWNLYGVIFGITSAFFMYLAAPSLINVWFKKNAGLAISITAAILSLLAAIASPIGQNLINEAGWQTARFAMATFSTVLAVIICALFVRKDPYSMGLLPFGANEEEEKARAEGKEMPQVEGATIAQATKSPGLYMLIFVAGIIVLCAAFLQQIPAYCARTELGADVGAVALSILMVGGVVGKLILGALNDLIGIKITALISLGGGALGIAIGWLAGANVPLFYAGMTIFGFGYAGLTVVVPMLTRGAFGSLNYTQIYSWVSTGIFIATAISFFMFATIYDTTGSYDLGFMIVIALYAVGAILVPILLKSAQSSWVDKTPELGKEAK